MKVAGYIRVSTDPQLEKFGPAAQVHEITQYARQQGYELTHIYQDAITGKSESREQLSNLLREASRYGTVILSGVDRLARRIPAAYRILEELQETQLEVHVSEIRGAVNLEDDDGAMQFGVRALMAELNHRNLVNVLRRAKEAKVRGGQPLAPLNGFGFKNGAIDPEQARIVWKVYEWALKDGGTTYIQRQLALGGIPSPTGKRVWDRCTILKMLRNPLYRGEYQYGRDRLGRPPKTRELLKCRVPQIIDDELWHAANARVDARKTKQGRRGERLDIYPLTGRFFCGHCGRAIVGSPKTYQRVDGGKTITHFYTCGDKHVKASTQKGCPHRKYYKAELLHAAIRDKLGALLNDPALLAAAVIRPQLQAPDTEGARRSLEAKLVKAREAFLADVMDLDEYGTVKRQLHAQLTALEQSKTPATLPTPNLATLQNHLRQVLQGACLAQIARAVGLRVEMTRHGDEVHLALTVDPPPL